jgi:secreted PhoX family phosphatase
MSDLTRREFLKFVGASGAVASIGTLATLREAHASGLWFTPVRIPSPLPIYATSPNWLATGLNGAGTTLPAGPAEFTDPYTVIDDVIVPPEYKRYIIVQWGDRVYPKKRDYFGFNNDHTGYVPILGNWDGLLVVNHEYTSYPFHQLSPATNTGFGNGDPSALNRTFEAATGLTLPSAKNIFDLDATQKRQLYGEQCYNIGLSVVRVKRRERRGRLHVVSGDWRNRRVHLLSGLAINAERADAYSGVTSWGPTAHEKGDDNYLVGTGPAASQVFDALNSDGLGNRIIGTGFNCSGGVTPWGTVFSAEENFQGSVARFTNPAPPAPPNPNAGKVDLANSFYIGVQEAVKPDGTQTAYVPDTVGAEFGLVGEKYGWLVEIDPSEPHSRVKKHTWLGRFRHENIAVRADRGNPLVCYMGDDRRGGHWWKFVSKGVIRRRRDKSNSELFEAGRLYVARFNADGTGEWITLELGTPTNPNDPTVISQVQFDQQGARDRNGLVKLPLRLGTPAASGAGITTVVPANGGFANVDTTNQATVLPFYQGKTLADFYTSQGALLCDAFAAANLVGGTPCARPEDCEVHPYTKAVFMTQTDAAAGSDGYADSRIFTVAKYEAAVDSAQQSGDIIRLVENSSDGAGTGFTWSRFSKAGEVGTQPDGTGEPAPGMGYANVDNLAFDTLANLWGVTDVSTGLHNGVGDGPNPSALTVDHSGVGSGGSAGGNLVGVFGNNWMLFIPTYGRYAGMHFPFAIGPTRTEMTGPTFVGNTLVLAVQHPGEDSPTRAALAANPTFTRDIQILKADGSGTFDQERNVPVGSQWPGNIAKPRTEIARPAVIGIQRKQRSWREHWEHEGREED